MVLLYAFSGMNIEVLENVFRECIQTIDFIPKCFVRETVLTNKAKNLNSLHVWEELATFG